MSNYANEKLDRYYEIKIQGCNIEKVENRVMGILCLERDVLLFKGRRKMQVAARSLLCYWAVRELGHTVTELAKRLGVTQPTVSCAVSRGERIAKESSLNLYIYGRPPLYFIGEPEAFIGPLMKASNSCKIQVAAHRR